MAIRRRSSTFSNEEEIDPTSQIINMVDLMLVLAVGFMIFAIMSTGMDSIVFSDMPQEQKQSAMEAAKNTVELDQGKELDEIPENVSTSGSGYTEMGKVYQDPSTGKLVMVEDDSSGT